MYKRLSLDQLCNINCSFFDNLKNLYTKRRYTYLKEFLKDIWSEWPEVYFFESSIPVFKITKTEDICYLVDEKEKIELEISTQDINSLHNILKDQKKVVRMNKNNKTILQGLFDEFAQWQLSLIQDKPFLVYDIETIWSVSDLESMQFEVAYSIVSDEDHSDKFKYRYISKDRIKWFVDFLLDFDGFIIWYNNIHFDNPVVVYNTDYTKQEIKTINEKSLDLFLFIRNLTGRRLWLNDVASSLISVGKTLSSWQEWTDLLVQYQKTWDEKLLNKVKNYCKNDVKMTLWVLLYMLKYKRLYIDEQDYTYKTADFVKLASTVKKMNGDTGVRSIFYE